MDPVQRKEYDRYLTMKQFLGFGPADILNLKSMRPYLAKHQPSITEFFYFTLGNFPETAVFLEGRRDSLKKTHRTWFLQLTAGEYGEPYFLSRWRIGVAHSRISLAPHWVELVMSVIRTKSLWALMQEMKPTEVAAKYESLTKIIDLDLMLINRAYVYTTIEAR